MSTARHSEAAFETVIESHLLQNGYVSVPPGGFDRAHFLTELRKVRRQDRRCNKRLRHAGWLAAANTTRNGLGIVRKRGPCFRTRIERRNRRVSPRAAG